MNKRKIILLAVSLCMVAILAVGGTLAYFTDTDQEINVFTVGNVQIDLIEKERDGNGGLQDFSDDKKLLPIVGSAQGEKDEFGLPTAKNYVDKIVTVKVLDKSEDAYVRVLMAFPVAMDAATEANMPLHWNAGNKYVAEGGKDDGNALNTDYDNWTVTGPIHKDVEIKGYPGKYNIYSFTYEKPMVANEETGSACVVGFYMDARVDYDEEKGYFLKIGETIYDLDDAIDENGKVYVPVFAQGVQAKGFDNATQAFTDAQLPTNPWAEDGWENAN